MKPVKQDTITRALPNLSTCPLESSQGDAVYRFSFHVSPSDLTELDARLGDVVLHEPLKAKALFRSVSRVGPNLRLDISESEFASVVSQLYQVNVSCPLGLLFVHKDTVTHGPDPHGESGKASPYVRLGPTER